MHDRTQRAQVDRPEGVGPVPEWELFCRETANDPLRHVGSVTAGSAGEAHEHATALFGADALDVWVCPAGEVRRYSSREAIPADEAADEPADEAPDGRDADAADDTGPSSTGVSQS